MLKPALLLFLLLCLLPVPCAQGAAGRPADRKELTTLDMPEWLIEFSNLPGKQREQYLQNFSKAKLAYQKGEWVVCYSALADCEMIFKGNPNVWNLRACCLMEQKFLDEAAAELEKARRALPHDPVTELNVANLHLASGRYKESLEIIDSLMPGLQDTSPAELIDVLIFRKVLALVLMNRIDEAEKLVRHLNALSDTPLYYYSRAAICMAEGRKPEALRSLRVVQSIFAKGNSLIPYQRAFELSRLAESAQQTPH